MASMAFWIVVGDIVLIRAVVDQITRDPNIEHPVMPQLDTLWALQRTDIQWDKEVLPGQFWRLPFLAEAEEQLK